MLESRNTYTAKQHGKPLAVTRCEFNLALRVYMKCLFLRIQQKLCSLADSKMSLIPLCFKFANSFVCCYINLKIAN